MYAIVVCMASMLNCEVLPFLFHDIDECGFAASEYVRNNPRYFHGGCIELDEPQDYGSF